MKRNGKIVNKNNKSKKKVTYKRGLKRKSSKNVGKKKRSKISYKRKRITRKKVKRGGAAAAAPDNLGNRTSELSSKCGMSEAQFYFLARHRCADAKHDGMVIENDLRYSYKSILMTMGYSSQQSEQIIAQHVVKIHDNEWNILTDLNPNIKDIMQGKGTDRNGRIEINIFGNKYDYTIYNVVGGKLEAPPHHTDKRDLITQLREQDPPAVIQFDNSSLHKYMKTKHGESPLNILKQFAFLNDPGSSVSDADINREGNIPKKYEGYDRFTFLNYVGNYDGVDEKSPIAYPNCVFNITWSDKIGESCQINFEHPNKPEVKKIYTASSSTKNKPNSISSLKKAFAQLGKLISLCAKRKFKNKKSAKISPDMIDETNYLLTGLNSFCKYSGDCGFRWELEYLNNEIDNNGYICTIDRMLVAFGFMTKMNGIIYKVPFSSKNPSAPKQYILFKLNQDDEQSLPPGESRDDYITRKTSEIISHNQKLIHLMGPELNTFYDNRYEIILRSADNIFNLFYYFLEIENDVNTYLSKSMLNLITRLMEPKNQDPNEQLKFIKDYDSITDFIPLYGEIVEKLKDIEESPTGLEEKAELLTELFNNDIHMCLFSRIYKDENNKRKWEIIENLFNERIVQFNRTQEEALQTTTADENVIEHNNEHANLSTAPDEATMGIKTGGASLVYGPTQKRQTTSRTMKEARSTFMTNQEEDLVQVYKNFLPVFYNFFDNIANFEDFLSVLSLNNKYIPHDPTQDLTQVPTEDKSQLIQHILTQMPLLFTLSPINNIRVFFQNMIHDVDDLIKESEQEVIGLVNNIYYYLCIASRYRSI